MPKVCQKCGREDVLINVAEVGKDLCPNCAAQYIRIPVKLLRDFITANHNIEKA